MGLLLPVPRIFFARVLNSSSSKIFDSSISSGFFLSISESRVSKRSSISGMSVFIVARNLEIFMSSICSETFFPRAPFMLLAFSMMFSQEPYSFMSLAAVFSPTPGQPGKLSALSPINAKRSIT